MVESEAQAAATTDDVEMQDEEEEKLNPAEAGEAKKLEGNTALKAGEVDKAIALYSQAIELCKNEGMFTNRAVAYIQKKKFKEALFDCEQALYINP